MDFQDVFVCKPSQCDGTNAQIIRYQDCRLDFHEFSWFFSNGKTSDLSICDVSHIVLIGSVKASKKGQGLWIFMGQFDEPIWLNYNDSLIADHSGHVGMISLIQNHHFSDVTS